MNIIIIVWKEIVYGFNESKWLPLLTAYAVLSSIIGPGLHYPMLHLPFLALGFLLSMKNISGFGIAPLLLLLYLPFNVAVTHPDPVFNSWVRLVLFSAVFVFLSPLLKGKSLGSFRKKILLGILLICVFLGLGSFVCYFLGINYMRNTAVGDVISDYAETAGGFGGLVNQSISLGFVCGLGMLYLFYRALQRNMLSRKWYYAAMAVLTMAILISASRIALLSAVGGGLAMLYNNKMSKGKFIRILMGLFIVGLLTFPLWENFTAGLQKKNENNIELGMYGSRTDKWKARMTEFSSNPIIGIGYASVDSNLDDVGVGGAVEPGSSWLAILSMTGIIGLLLLVAIIRKPFIYLKAHPSPYNSLLLGLFVYVCVHMISEGYIFAGGSSLCFIAWLIFGCCSDATYQDSDSI